MKVFQFKICCDFYGPAPTIYKPVFVVASDYDSAIQILVNSIKDLYSIELISVNHVLTS